MSAQKAYNELHFKTRVDEVLVDIYYYMNKSAKRLQKLKEFQTLSGVNQRKILKHVSTRWLSLGTCINRLLEQFFDKEVVEFDKKTKSSSKTGTKTPDSKTQSTTTSSSSGTSKMLQKSNVKPNPAVQQQLQQRNPNLKQKH